MYQYHRYCDSDSKKLIRYCDRYDWDLPTTPATRHSLMVKLQSMERTGHTPEVTSVKPQVCFVSTRTKHSRASFAFAKSKISSSGHNHSRPYSGAYCTASIVIRGKPEKRGTCLLLTLLRAPSSPPTEAKPGSWKSFQKRP